MGELGKFNNNFEKVVSWPEKDFNSLMFCAVDDPDKLESIRTHFAPAHVLNQGMSINLRNKRPLRAIANISTAMSGHLSEASQVAIGDSYLEALQSLSPSRWIICETRTLDKPDDFSELREVYRSLLSGIAWKEIHTMGSIQITGPSGYGKSALVKLISHQIRQRSSVVVIDNLLSSSERRSPTLYGVYVSFLHQIISQRPSLFLPIQNLMAEMLRQETWTEESPWILLATVFHHSRAVDFLIVIYDFEDWPREIRSWWSETLGSFVKSCGSTCTFLTSSHCLINDLTPVLPHELDLKSEYERHRKDFIRAKTKSLLNNAHGSITSRKRPSDNIKKIMSATEKFRGSFTAINTYLVLLFQTFTLNTLDAIVSDIESSPQTEEKFYELEIGALWTKSHKIRSWASLVLSWILWSVRPLRIEELGSVVAVKLDDSSVSQLRPVVSMDIERDLRSHLGLLVAIENGYPRVKSALVRKILIKDDRWKLHGMKNNSDLTRLCLHYITLFLKDKKPKTWEKCLSQVSWKHQALGPQDRALEFLDYACRFWPTHFLLVKEPDSSLKDTVVQFLLAPKIGERWFQLYRLCISQTANPLFGDQETPRRATAVSEPVLKIPEKTSLAGDDAKTSSSDKAATRRRLAVHMASFVGLGSIIPEILGSPVPVKNLRTMNVRRGYSERVVVFSDTGSRYYLDCAICNDDDSVVKELLESDPARTIEYFPLHKAVQGGCLKTARTLFNLLDNPTQTDQDGRTPLHLAAIGGSTKILRFLLGKDVSDTYPRRIDVHDMMDVQDCNFQTPLIIASRMGNFKAAKLLIKSGADLAIRDGAGRTALHYAVSNCPEAIEDFVFRDSAQVRDNDDCKLLHTAASSGSVQTTSILVSAFSISRDPFEALSARDGQDKTPFHYAAENGHTEIVQLLLNYKGTTESEDESYQQAAELAAARGHLATVKLFIIAVKKIRGYKILEAASRAGQLLVVEHLLRNELASPDGDQSYARPISSAASKGYKEVVRTLLRYNAAVNIQDATRQTPLHHAAENGRYYVAQTLLKNGANVNAPDTERNTPLHSAAKAGRVGVIELLKKYEADVEACTRTKETPLHLAVKNPKAVEALLNANADRTAADIFGQTPLHLATRWKCYESADLLRWTADIDAKDDDGRPPLYYAISQQDLTMVKLLCKDRPDLRDSQDHMHPALQWAVQYSALEVLAFLLSISLDSVNKLDKYGRGIIHEAAQKESLEILILVVESGADVNLPDRSKGTPLHDASRAGRVQNIQILIGKDADVNKVDENEKTRLHMAAECNDVGAVTVLLEAKATINIQDDRQRTPLCSAAYCGHVQAVERLLEKNADVKIVDNEGWSPLHAAADNLEITRMLIAHGADVDLQKEDLWSPLHLAASWAETAVAELLIEKGANPNQINNSGHTALHLVIMKNDANLVELMLDKGADAKIKTRDGLSCLSLAVDEDSYKTLEVLLGAGTISASGVVWDYEDMVSAYWRAIEYNIPNSLTVLVNKEGRLLNEVSEHGFTGLETCLRNRMKIYEEELMAIRLLELGADPFKRRQTDQESAFELGIICRRKPKLEFMDACLERVPEDLSSAATGLGFKELRIAAELDKPDLWKKLEPLREAVSAATDNDGWSLDHFIHQSADRIPAHLKDRLPLQPTRTPTGLVALPMWLPLDMDIEARMEIAPSRLQVSFACE